MWAAGWLVLLGCGVAGAAPPRKTAPASIPQDFEFVYETGYGTKIDTYTDRYTHDLVLDPDVTIRLVLSKSEKSKVYAKMKDIGFFELPEPHPPYPEPNCRVSPSTTFRLEARTGSKARRLSWSNEHCIHRDAEHWQGLEELTTLIEAILGARPEVRALPRPRGAYL